MGGNNQDHLFPITFSRLEAIEFIAYNTDGIPLDLIQCNHRTVKSLLFECCVLDVEQVLSKVGSLLALEKLKVIMGDDVSCIVRWMKDYKALRKITMRTMHLGEEPFNVDMIEAIVPIEW